MNEQFASLLLFTIGMTISPGSNNVLMTSSRVRVGVRRSIPLGLGIVVGMVLMLTASAIGLGALIHGHPEVELAMKLVGSTYLVWLGWRIAHAGAPDFTTSNRGNRPGFVAGFVNSVLNPKGWAMAMSAAAGYTALASSSTELAAILSLVFAVVMVPN